MQAGGARGSGRNVYLQCLGSGQRKDKGGETGSGASPHMSEAQGQGRAGPLTAVWFPGRKRRQWRGWGWLNRACPDTAPWGCKVFTVGGLSTGHTGPGFMAFATLPQNQNYLKKGFFFFFFKLHALWNTREENLVLQKALRTNKTGENRHRLAHRPSQPKALVSTERLMVQPVFKPAGGTGD